MLSTMISRPRQPENDIDVYISPLIEDLRLLWDEGIEVFYAYQKVNFNLRALLCLLDMGGRNVTLVIEGF